MGIFKKYIYGSLIVRDNIQSTTSSATGATSFAFGKNTKAFGTYSHAEGYNTTASGINSHAEGYKTIASGKGSHSQGYYTTASGENSHSGGKGLDGGSNRIIASGDTSFIHFKQTSVSGGVTGAYGDYSAILGGNDHNIGTGSTSSGIFVGSGNTISNDVLRSVVLGGSNITGTTNDTVYVPQLNISVSYTPTSSGDTIGEIGSLTWDDNYVYIKTNSGWGRSPLDYIF